MGRNFLCSPAPVHYSSFSALLWSLSAQAQDWAAGPDPGWDWVLLNRSWACSGQQGWGQEAGGKDTCVAMATGSSTTGCSHWDSIWNHTPKIIPTQTQIHAAGRELGWFSFGKQHLESTAAGEEGFLFKSWNENLGTHKACSSLVCNHLCETQVCVHTFIVNSDGALDIMSMEVKLMGPVLLV